MSGEDSFALAHSKIAILGLGLMGGSLALALKAKCAALYGVDPDPAALAMARRQNVVDRADADPSKLLPEADLVILAAPVPAILTLLEELPSFTANPCVVLDLGSTKRWIVAAMSRLPDRFDPIGGHPICGKETLSLANAEGTLYQEAPFLLSPLQRTSARALSAAHQIIEAIGARAMIVNAAEHDGVLASVSHLPFLMAAALSLATPIQAAPFAGPGFRSAVRLAGTPTSMMQGVLESNQDNVLDALHSLQNSLTALKSILASRDFSKLEANLEQARGKYRTFVS